MARSQSTVLCVAALLLLAWPQLAAAAGPKGASFTVKTRFNGTSYLLEAAEFLVGVPRVHASRHPVTRVPRFTAWSVHGPTLPMCLMGRAGVCSIRSIQSRGPDASAWCSWCALHPLQRPHQPQIVTVAHPSTLWRLWRSTHARGAHARHPALHAAFRPAAAGGRGQWPCVAVPRAVWRGSAGG